MENTPIDPRETSDKFEIIEALHRFAAGIDLSDNDLLLSAFTADAISDFGPAGKKAGFEFPLLEGRDNIVATLMRSLETIDTTHSVSNALVTLNGDHAVMNALVEAQHLPSDDHSRNYLMKNRYRVDLVRQDHIWLIQRLTIDNVWRSGDVTVLTAI